MVAFYVNNIKIYKNLRYKNLVMVIFHANNIRIYKNLRYVFVLLTLEFKIQKSCDILNSELKRNIRTKIS